MTVNTSELTIGVNGLQMPAYLSRPDPGSGPHPAVIVLQEIFGVNKEVKRITDLVASAGYVGLAINYYHRTHPDLNEPYDQGGLERGFKAAGNVSRESLRADVSAAVQWLNEQDFVVKNKVATWGFCFGGTVAFTTATVAGLSGAVCFYGGNIAVPLPNGEPPPLADVEQITCPLLLCYGENDDYITAEHRARTEEALRRAGKDFQIIVYPNVGHAFFRESTEQMRQGSVYSEAVADAWNVVQAFFKRVLH